MVPSKVRGRLAKIALFLVPAAFALAMVSATPSTAETKSAQAMNLRRQILPFRDGSTFLISIEGVPAGVTSVNATYTHVWPGGQATSTTWPVHASGALTRNWAQRGSVLSVVLDSRMPQPPASPGTARGPRISPGTGVLAITTTPYSATNPNQLIDVEPVSGVVSCP